jgi:hypothetical protein
VNPYPYSPGFNVATWLLEKDVFEWGKNGAIFTPINALY